MTQILSGPRLPPRSGQAKQLVVFLHGYGSDGQDLIDLGQYWQDLLPDAAFVSPDAPEPCGMSPYGRQWFALTMRDPDERWRGVNQAQPTLDAFLDAELTSLGLTDASLALVGFSQGTMMALHVGLRRALAPAAILGFSGTLVGPEHLSQATARSVDGKPPHVFLLHGDRDEVIPVQALSQAASSLESVGIACGTHISHGMGHGIDQEGLRLGGLFLAKSFGVPIPQA